MKKIISAFFILSILSCSLEKESKTSWNEDKYFETEGQLKSLLNGGYVCMQKALGSGNSTNALEITSTFKLRVTSSYSTFDAIATVASS